MASIAGTVESLPPWALYGGAGVAAGGGYLLYRRRKAASASVPAATAAAAPAAVQSALDLGAQTQQPSIVPYYLTANSPGTPNGATAATDQVKKRKPPKTIPASIPSATGAGTTTLPDIPPLLPVAPTAAPVPAPTAPSTPAPATAPGGSNNIPADVLQKIQAGGEQIIGQLGAPGGGVWWLGSKGGVFNEGGAPFFGSANPYGFDDPNVRKAVSIVPLGKGYRVISNRGENYDFPG